MKHLFGKDLNAALLLMVATVSINSVADDNHYRWQNSSGETVFSDQPPPEGEKYDVINTPPAPKPVTSEAGGDVPQETASSGSGEVDSKNNAELCRSAKANLRVLESPDKVSVRDEEGTVHEISPQERTIMQQTARAKIDVYCE